MNVPLILLILCIAIGLSVGQILFKKAALTLGDHSSVSFLIWNAITNIWLVMAFVLYFLTSVGWVLLLRKVPLSLAYPITSASYLFVPIASILVFSEPYSWRLAVASVLIVISIIIIGFEAQ